MLPSGLFEFFDDAIQYFLGTALAFSRPFRCSRCVVLTEIVGRAGFEAYAVVYRLPRDTVNWTIVRPSKLEASNALAEWKVLMMRMVMVMVDDDDDGDDDDGGAHDDENSDNENDE